MAARLHCSVCALAAWQCCCSWRPYAASRGYARSGRSGATCVRLLSCFHVWPGPLPSFTSLVLGLTVGCCAEKLNGSLLKAIWVEFICTMLFIYLATGSICFGCHTWVTPVQHIGMRCCCPPAACLAVSVSWPCSCCCLADHGHNLGPRHLHTEAMLGRRAATSNSSSGVAANGAAVKPVDCFLSADRVLNIATSFGVTIFALVYASSAFSGRPLVRLRVPCQRA